jgi:hypothetical protein
METWNVTFELLPKVFFISLLEKGKSFSYDGTFYVCDLDKVQSLIVQLGNFGKKIGKLIKANMKSDTTNFTSY